MARSEPCRVCVGWPDERCLACGRPLGDTRLTLPRAKTGDLVFCGWYCMQQWDTARQQAS